VAGARSDTLIKHSELLRMWEVEEATDDVWVPHVSEMSGGGGGLFRVILSVQLYVPLIHMTGVPAFLMTYLE
jgi:hypothetical protein